MQALRSMTLRLVCAIAAIVLPAATARAQGTPANLQGRYPLGNYVSVTPAIVMVGGYDTNFVRSNIGEAAREFYASPQLDTWIGKGRTQLNVTGALEYQRISSGNTLNNFVSAAATTGSGIVTLQASATHRDHFAPPSDFVGFEVGIRSRRVEREFSGTVSVAPGRLRLSGAVEHYRLRYDADQRYQGSSLRENLNRDSTWLNGTVDFALTPLAALSVIGGHVDDTFLFAPQRDGSGWRVLGGFSFSPRGTLTGYARVGVMKYVTKRSGISYSGPAHLVGLQVTRQTLILDVQANREIRFSFDPSRGFYLSTGVDGYLSAKLGQRFETFGRGSLRSIEAQGPAALEEPTRRVWVAKGGLVYRLTTILRIGAELERYDYGARSAGGFNGTRYTGFLIWGPDNLRRLDRPLPGQF
jgi:hypothetical protein